jgi:hypothetical protein
MMKQVLFLAVLSAVGCGSKTNGGAQEPSGATIDPNMSRGDSTDRSGEQIDPAKMDEVNQLLDRRRNIVSRCLSQAVEAGNAPKNAHGKMTLEIKIANGKATSVQIVKSSIESQEVQGCVKRHVEEIAFPQMKKPFETSYTYAMETN